MNINDHQVLTDILLSKLDRHVIINAEKCLDKPQQV